ncbi:MAG: LysR family transcriptional regulator [Gammaproteobacteria bacterium]
MNKLQAMEVFVQVVDAGGFTRAAEMMQLPKASVSTLVQQLEQTLQVKLLHRTTRQVTVTADGAAYYERCLRILLDVREAEESLSHNRVSPSGRLRVDTMTAIAADIIIPALPDFFERYPDIRLDLGGSERQVDLIEEGVDLAIRGGALNDPNLIARRVGVMNFVTCATPGYLAKYGRPAHPNELSAHRAVNYFSSKTGKTYDWDFVRGDERIDVPMPSCLAVNDTSMFMAACLRDMGMVQMPIYMAEPLVAEGKLQMILEDWGTSPVPIHVVYPQNRHLSAKVRVFVEWVAELFASDERLKLKRN